jgi:hypothetical protein
MRAADQPATQVHYGPMANAVPAFLDEHGARPEPLNEGRVVSRKSILEEVWGLHEDTDTRAIDNFIVRLRRYIEDNPSEPRHLLTVRGVGYRFIAEPEKK